MLSTRKLIEAAKANNPEIPSNYRLGKVLGVSENTIYNWTTGKSFPDGVNTIRLAALGGLDPAEALAAVNAERGAESPEVRKALDTIAKRARAAAVAAMSVILSLFISGGPDGGALAAELQRPAITAPASGDALYIMSTLARSMVARALASLGALFSPTLQPA